MKDEVEVFFGLYFGFLRQVVGNLVPVYVVLVETCEYGTTSFFGSYRECDGDVVKGSLIREGCPVPYFRSGVLVECQVYVGFGVPVCGDAVY